MHLRPRTKRDIDDPFRLLPPLPVEWTAVEVLADYLKYLFKCTKAFLEESQPDGEILWASLEPSIEFVMSYPDGWGVIARSHMYKAAFLAGFFPDNASGQKRLSFVTEGKANLYFALRHGLGKCISEVSDHLKALYSRLRGTRERRE